MFVSTSDLKRTVKYHLFDHYRSWARSSRVTLQETEELAWIETDIPWRFLNGVFKTRLTPEGVDAVIERTVAHLRERGAPRMIWWLEPEMQPANLGRYLENHGFELDSGGTAMAIELDRFPEGTAGPPELSVQEVNSKERLSRWSRVVARCFAPFFDGDETAFAGWFYEVYSQLGFSLPLRSYIGVLDGRVVATSQLFLSSGVAGIYWVSSLPEVRGKGIGAELTRAPLWDARSLGCRVAILHASKMGYPVYQRLGFQEVCEMDRYRWEDPDRKP